MDKGRILAEGSPRELIAAHASREVVELRFPPGEQDRHLPSLVDLATRIEELPDRLLLSTDDADHTVAALGERSIHAESVLVRRSTLEDVFLELTGRSLVD